MPEQKNVASWLSVVFVTSLLAMLLLPLPRLGETLVGHGLGIIGSLLMLLTLVYPFRKRILGRKGRKNPITTHMIFGLLGSILVVIHAGGVLNSLIVNLLFLIMIGVILSGISGMFLYSRIRRTVKDYQQESSYLKQLFRKRIKNISALDVRSCFRIDQMLGRLDEEALAQQGVETPTVRQCQDLERLVEAVGDVEYSIEVYDASQRIFGKWSLVHIHLAFFLFSLMGTHIATVMYYGLPWLS
ncbi:MAG: hypothetical protein K9K64_07665 [Desulfohalobiaceae bacterium]|nr:hypothetical protein [Desulfohalobiaceae bacterium]